MSKRTFKNALMRKKVTAVPRRTIKVGKDEVKLYDIYKQVRTA